MESRLFEPQRETTIDLKNQVVRETRGKIAVFDCGRETTFGSNYREVLKNKGSRNQDSVALL